MSMEDTLKAIREGRRAIREHRDQIGDYRCWVDDTVLYHRVLPEFRETVPAVPDPETFHSYCEAYYVNRQNPEEQKQEIPLDSSSGPLSLEYDAALDQDLDLLNKSQLTEHLEALQQAVRLHAEVGYLDRTFTDDIQLYRSLPEPVTVVTQLPPREQFLGTNCPAYNAHCQNHPEQFAAGLWKVR